MNILLVFGLGVLCGMVGIVLLVFLYSSLKINDIDKKQ